LISSLFHSINLIYPKEKKKKKKKNQQKKRIKKKDEYEIIR